MATLGAKDWLSGSWEASQEIGEKEGGSGASEHWGEEQSSGDPVGRASLRRVLGQLIVGKEVALKRTITG